MSRYLLFPFGIGSGVAHLGTCLTLAAELRRRGHEATVAYGGTARALVTDVPILAVKELALTPEAHVPPSRWFRSAGELEELVEADIAAIEQVRPDVVVADTRVSAALAAEMLGVPRLELMHFLPSHNVRPRFRHGWQNLSGPVGAIARRAHLKAPADAGLVEVINVVRRRRGLNRVAGLWEQTDTVACTTTPVLDPGPELPDSWNYVGPILWSAPGELPSSLADRQRPLVYVTQGSTGSSALLHRAIDELADQPVDVLVTTAHLCDPEELAARADNVVARRYLPGQACMRAADVAVIHGGHLTGCEAHRAGVPVVVLPHAADHWRWASRADRLGTGLPIAPWGPRGSVARGVRRVLRDDRFRSAASAIAQHLVDWDGATRAADRAEALVSS
ncbi:MAG: hypothetical protein QOI02_1592 [Actinomycetota bacterium]|jgi:MGT family glycosyltransferase|nr:hypothetical protein [Actinomycetota bacterium]